ncbi:MAG: response regulator transcription factor [Fervidobacterium sp.]|uniref:Two-component system, OmpR family, response regulator n=1 Tax=Fervidobacterium gondwanense DSM 13020 TaxID=1121883 RepID=A0A1M7TIA7_FERGO|nr:response regulator transcription factor [Fervidobacterium gondwanense]UXF00231.1 transcriptional regulator [Fervidobacterium riparium]SHN70482.1 two-component system, OmpR family, response regulator [Fervidobacterium gondwanense DSM 13020]
MTVLVVEDERALAESLARLLQGEGFEVSVAYGINEMYKKLGEISPNLIVLDLMLPDGNALNEIQDIKSNFPEIGIIIISAKNTDLDKILGIELGADDYVGKPFNPREVAARVKAFFRRTRGLKEVIKYGKLEIYPDDYVVTYDGEPIELTTREFEILKLLAQRPDRVFSREQILEELWKDEFEVYDRVVDVHINSLRKKLGKNWIITIRGVGYKFSKKGDKDSEE